MANLLDCSTVGTSPKGYHRREDTDPSIKVTLLSPKCTLLVQINPWEKGHPSVKDKISFPNGGH